MMPVQEDKGEPRLKRLGFVRVAVIHTLVYVFFLYDYAKQKLGPLKPAVGTAESAVTVVVGPAYQKLKGLPDDVLIFLDAKVDEAAHKFDEHAPPAAKHVASQAHCLILKGADKAQQVVGVLHEGGPRAAVHYVANDSKDFVLGQSVKAWVKLDQYPVIHRVAEITVPVAANLSERYNQVVKDMSRKGYPLFAYLPLVPIEQISKTFNKGRTADKGIVVMEEIQETDGSAYKGVVMEETPETDG